MNFNWVVFQKKTFEKVGELCTDRSISFDDALSFLGAKRLDMVNPDDPDLMIDGKEYWSEDLDLLLEDNYLAEIVSSANTWDQPRVMEAMTDLCYHAGQRLKNMVSNGQDCSGIFKDLRSCVEDSVEFFEGTPDVSDDTSDIIDWLRDGGEQADMLRLAYVVEAILGVDLV